MRTGLSVGETSTVSSINDRVRRFYPRAFDERERASPLFVKPHFDDLARESLCSKCIRVLVLNFERLPVYDGVPAKFLREITSKVSTNLDPIIASLYIFDENYWKRRCVEQLGWQKCQLWEHGLCWKQLFFEHYVARQIENFGVNLDANEVGPNNTLPSKFEEVIKLLQSCQDNLFTLKVRQMIDHLDIESILQCLPNLTCLDLNYGINDLGMKYERSMLGMKISGALSLAQALPNCTCLTMLILQRSLIDDDLLHLLVPGLVNTVTMVYLDLSHNKIGNQGAKILAKLLVGTNSILTYLNLTNNQIGLDGAKYIGEALIGNEALEELNMRLNRLTDNGGSALLKGLKRNSKLSILNFSGNLLGENTVQELSEWLKYSKCSLNTLDLSCNQLRDKEAQTLWNSISFRNSQLESIDLRNNQFSEGLKELDEIELKVQSNSLSQIP